MNSSVNRTTLFLIGVALPLLVAGGIWLSRPAHHFGKTEVSPFENDMIESLVRGILPEDGIRNAPVCFVSFGEGRTTPSSDFLHRFADCRNPVVHGTGSSVAPPIDRYFDKYTGRPGTVIQIINLHEYIPGVFDITVSISTRPRGHEREVYRIANIGGTWTIKSHTPV